MIPSRPVRRRRALVPREHGAWGQLLVPLVAALVAVARTSEAAVGVAASLWVAGTALLAFLAHEPLLVLTGQRGARARADDGARARRLLLVEGVLAVGCGAMALRGLPAAALSSLLIPAALGAATALVAVRHAIKSLGGELLAAAALSSSAVPVMTAGGQRLEAGLALWLILLTGFVQATLAVRALVARLGPWPARRATRVAAGLIAPTTIGPAMLVGAGAPLLGAAFLPVGLATLSVAALAPHPRHLRTIGWITAAATVCCAALTVVALH